MLENYFKIAVRNLLKNRLYSAINIFGLAVGLAAVITILLFLKYELTFDGFHAKGDRTYRISIASYGEGGLEEDSPVFTPPIGPAMAEEFPGVEQYTRISTLRTAYLSREGKTLRSEKVCYADSTFFDVLSFELLSGNPSRALRDPYMVVITAEYARRLFGDADPVGRPVELNGEKGYTVSGVVATPPVHSHLDFEVLLSFATLFEDPQLYLDWNGGNQYVTYVRLRENIRPDEIEAGLPPFMWRHINEMLDPFGIRLEPYLQPLADIHLYHEPYSNGLRTNLYIFGAVGLLILFIACINFINLTTARASWRAKEIGVRKVLGAERKHLARQFLGESLLVSTFALIAALFLVETASPVLERFFERPLAFSSLFDGKIMLALLLILILVGMAAGSYPAFYLSSINAIRTLKGKGGSDKPKQGNSQGLVVLQFAISTALIICTLVVYQQLDYARSKELGFEKEEVLLLPLVGDSVQHSFSTLKREMIQLPGVQIASGISEAPGGGLTSNGYIPEELTQPLMFHAIDVDEDFLETFGLALADGRFFSAERPTDRNGYLINQTLAGDLSWETPVGKTINRNGDHQVIGVVKDFHFASLHSPIEPLIISNRPWKDNFNLLALRLAPGDARQAVAAIREKWRSVVPQAPFDFYFLDDSIDQLYRSEQRFQHAFVFASGLSIIIALLGVFGLSTFAIERRTKEIGIRKVLGASSVAIVVLFSRKFVVLILFSLIIAFPTAWWAMHRWLDGFAYHIEMSWKVFLLAALFSIILALLTVGSKALRAGLSNPVDSLRYE